MAKLGFDQLSGASVLAAPLLADFRCHAAYILTPVGMQCISAPLSTFSSKQKGCGGPSLFSCVEGRVVSTHPLLQSLPVEEPPTQVIFLIPPSLSLGAGSSRVSAHLHCDPVLAPLDLQMCLLQHPTNPNVSLTMRDDAFELDPPLCDLLHSD